MVLLIGLGLIDLLFGIILAVSGLVDFSGSSLVFFLFILAFIKGVYSILTATAAGFYFDLLGMFDLLSGVFLFLVFSGIQFHFFVYLGIIVILKGIYSILFGLAHN